MAVPTNIKTLLSTLQNHFAHINLSEPENIKLANEYYKWTHLKTVLDSLKCCGIT